MTDDKMSGDAKETRGKLKESAGDLTGDENLKQQGQTEQAEGSLKKGMNKIKDAITGKS